MTSRTWIVATLVTGLLVVGAVLPVNAASAAVAPPVCAALAAQVDKAGVGSGAVFVASYPTATDKTLKNVAFLYDNAASALALIGCGDTPHARRIGDAILAALDHDRYWRDGRLRNGYLAGPVANPVQLGGWQKGGHWVEDGYQAGSDTGNMAWAMLALLALHKAGAGEKYLDGAVRIAAYVEKSYSPSGFTGGTFGGEPHPRRNSWKSTEHNVDLAAAFAALEHATHDQHWEKRAEQARSFVAAMWREDCGCFAVGTGLDGKTPNTFLALDAQLWPLLALPDGITRYGGALKMARTKMMVAGGFAYSQARGGLWTEGTAQAALLAKAMGQKKRAAHLLTVLVKTRARDGLYDASDRSANTGFRLDTDTTQERRYFAIPHLGATAWVAMAMRGFNPFTATRVQN
jgi:hypothetical protein